MYICPYCSIKIKYTESAIERHLKEHKFKEFHCLYCGNDFNRINKSIWDHMSIIHESNFLFVAARRSSQPNDKKHDIQIVYIGNSKEYQKFSFYKCIDPTVLEFMDPTVLDIQEQYKILKTNQKSDSIISFNKDLPSTKFNTQIKDDFYIKYADYEKLHHQKRQRSGSKSQTNQVPESIVQNIIQSSDQPTITYQYKLDHIRNL